MKNLRHNLLRQLTSIGIIIFGIIVISLGLVLPKVLLPVYEKNIYNYLRNPLDFVDSEIGSNEILTDVAYIFITRDDNTIISENFFQIIDLEPTQVLASINDDYGKFRYKANTYYFYTSGEDNVSKIAITDGTYINQIERDVVFVIFPVLLITLLIVLALIISWARRLVLNIYYLKDKVANIDNEEYMKMYKSDYHLDDELNALSKAIDEMHIALKTQEDYKNQMYQNLSHEFKTPLTVMKSYIEAMEDGVLSKEKGIAVIEEQVLKLENKVYSLLYLNKLNYLKEGDNYEESDVDLTPILKASIEKFKFENPNIKWELRAKDKEIFKGTFDMWEAIVDNMLNNFIRYADKSIKIVIKNDEITFYNDGPTIDESVIYEVFTPYKKGIRGKFGLGLSIIKKSLYLMGYDIDVNNEKKGVTFRIKRSI